MADDTLPKMTQAERDAQRQQIFDKLNALETKNASRDKAVEDLNEILPTLKAMAEAWESAAWSGKANKWIAGIVGAFAIIFAAVRLGSK